MEKNILHSNEQHAIQDRLISDRFEIMLVVLDLVYIPVKV